MAGLQWYNGKSVYIFREDKDVALEFINGGDIVCEWFDERYIVDLDRIDYVEIVMPTLFKKGDITIWDNETDDVMDMIVDAGHDGDEPVPVIIDLKYRQRKEAEEIVDILRQNGIDVRVE
ncbi:MAG: hypothetical protein J6B34_06415 [Clostridia bacterium]|nr:hypothetical protein [Clostridia bacterium]